MTNADKFLTDIINTQQTGYLSAIKVLLQQNNLDNNIFDLISLLDTYKLPDTNIQNVLNHYLSDNNFDISSFEFEN